MKRKNYKQKENIEKRAIVNDKKGQFTGIKFTESPLWKEKGEIKMKRCNYSKEKRKISGWYRKSKLGKEGNVLGFF